MSAAVAGGSPEARRRRARGYHGERSAASPDGDAAPRVKVEPDVDIKDYAETTMNELLGWYGYDKLDTRGLNLKNLNQHFPTSSSSSSPMRHDEDFSEEDTGRSRSPHPEPETAALNAGRGTIVCAWCLKTGLKLFTLKTSSGKTKAFCSEPCFNQCRRAAFKKNRVCNWCRHVRHTVNYVDFKDGDDQLQFCSDKCLNQYKMQIFCKETQAYLQMNPHLQEESSKQAGTASSKLITPDLWLRDCQEPLNGGTAPNLSHSDEEPTPPNIRTATPKSCNEGDIEDLTLSSKTERGSSPSNFISTHERGKCHETRKTSDDLPSGKDKRQFEMCNASDSYARDDRETSYVDRKKRHHENDKYHFRKRQKISSMRHKSNHQTEVPPAHLSSTTHSPLNLQNRLFQHSSSPYPPPLSTSSPSPLNPPAAHSKALPPHPALTGSLLPPGLPPPPPLLNNDFLHPPFSSSFFQPSLSPQQHLDAVLRLQSGIRPGEHPHLFQESMLPFLRNPPAQHSSTPFMQPNTVMLPYPVFVPLPVPIPIPIPLTSFLPKDKKQSGTDDNRKSSNGNPASDDNSDNVNVDSDSDSKKKGFIVKSKNSKSDTSNLTTVNTPKKEKQTPVVDTSSYAVRNNDSHTNRLILTRNKTR